VFLTWFESKHADQFIEDSEMKISVGEVLKLAKWLETKGLKETHEVIIETTSTGIGTCVEAKVRMTEDEGLFIDLTDYDSW
jgi:adenylosuccinate synthase